MAMIPVPVFGYEYLTIRCGLIIFQLYCRIIIGLAFIYVSGLIAPYWIMRSILEILFRYFPAKIINAIARLTLFIFPNIINSIYSELQSSDTQSRVLLRIFRSV